MVREIRNRAQESMDMIIRNLLGAAAALLIAGCALNMPGKNHKGAYNEKWSKAKNLTYAGGMRKQVHDQQLPAGAYNKEGKLQDYKLGNVSHPAYGAASGVVGVNVKPYGAFEHFYWGWTVPGASHYDHHRVFAWMPIAMAKDEIEARETLELMLTRSALTILNDMNYKYKPVKTPYQHNGLAFKQWYLEQTGANCSFARMNCVLSLYVPVPRPVDRAPFYSYFSMAGEPSWYFSAMDDDSFPRLSITEGEGLQSISENVFYQKLSARLPGWVYFYMAPNEVGIGDDNKTIAYPYLLEKGKPLLFIRPNK